MDWERIRFLEEAFPRSSKTDMLLDEIGTLFEDWESDNNKDNDDDSHNIK